MYTGILHLHKVVVGLFIFIYLVKTIFLLMPDKQEILDKISKITKIPEMVISFLMLGTGLYLLSNASEFTTLLMIKIGSVFASIPLAIIGFKKGVKPLAVLSLLLLVGSYGMAEIHKKRKTLIAPELLSISPTPDQLLQQAKSIYLSNCAACHGADGKLGLSGAKDLTASQLSYEQKYEVIKYGKNSMPGYRQLSDEQINALIQYTETLASPQN
jgi:cytochrome c553